MQAWHCIAIISITVLLFLYGTFRTEIEDTVYDQGVIEIEKGLTNDPPKKKYMEKMIPPQSLRSHLPGHNWKLYWNALPSPPQEFTPRQSGKLFWTFFTTI